MDSSVTLPIDSILVANSYFVFGDPYIAYHLPDLDLLFLQQLRCMSNSNAFMASRGSLDVLQPIQLNQLHDAPRPPLKKRKLSASNELAVDNIVIRVRCQPTQHLYSQRTDTPTLRPMPRPYTMNRTSLSRLRQSHGISSPSTG